MLRCVGDCGCVKAYALPYSRASDGVNVNDQLRMRCKTGPFLAWFFFDFFDFFLDFPYQTELLWGATLGKALKVMLLLLKQGRFDHEKALYRIVNSFNVPVCIRRCGIPRRRWG